MLPLAGGGGGRRLVLLQLLRTAATATAGGGSNPSHSQRGATPLSRHYSTAPPPGTSDPGTCRTASYLVASCGLPPAAASKVSRWFRISSTAKADAVLALLRRHGFSDADIARMLPRAPKILASDPEKVIRPKLDFFASLGVPTAALVGVPLLLCCSLEKHLVPCVESLRGILHTDANICAAISRDPYTLRFRFDRNVSPAVEALRHHGLTEDAVVKLLVTRLGTLTMATDRIAEIFEDLDSLGLPITHSSFVNGFFWLSKVKREALWRRVALYQSFGLSNSEVFQAFRSKPTILMFRDETIQEKLRFFRDDLKVPLMDVIAKPHVLTLSLEKSIIPRCAVLSVLMREGRIGKETNVLAQLVVCNKYFLKKYVTKYGKDLPDVAEAYTGKINFNGFVDAEAKVGSLVG